MLSFLIVGRSSSACCFPSVGGVRSAERAAGIERTAAGVLVRLGLYHRDSVLNRLRFGALKDLGICQAGGTLKMVGCLSCPFKPTQKGYTAQAKRLAQPEQPCLRDPVEALGSARNHDYLNHFVLVLL